MGNRAVLSATGLALYAASFVACLDDLPAPTSCPAAPRVPGSSCVGAINAENRPPGCFSPLDVECLSGPRPDRGCVPDECPPDADACWPDGDCPGAVIERAGADTECKRLSGDAYGLDIPSEWMCMHRCASCAALCDGIGPVLGTLNVPSSETAAFPLIVEIGSRMPDEGTLGIYMRVRGLANFQVIIGRGDAYLDDIANLDFTGVSYFVLTPLGTDFVEQVLYADSFLGVEPYEWSRHEDRPTVIVVFPPGGDTEAGLALYEIDCIVPFVVN